MLRIMDTLASLVARRAPMLGSRRGPASEKASATGPLIALETLGRPVWTPRDYQAFAREGFMQNAIVYRSVRMIAEAAASVPLLLYDGVEEIEEHPLLDLLRQPSPDHTSADFFESWYGYLLVAGNAYVEAVALSGRLRELHVLRPDRMKVVPGEEGWPEAFEYTVAGQTVRFADEPLRGVRPILHVRLFHPANDHYGMSPIEAAASAIDLHNTAARWNKALLDNSARPSGALVYGGSDGRMTAEQFERLKLELEQGFQGAKQAGRPLLLEGGLDWKPLNLSPKDMDFIEAKNAAAREIALALGVPPMLLGIPGDNTYSNYQEANRSFWRNTVLPLVARTAKAVSAWLAPAFALPEAGRQSLELRADLDQVEALAPEREALWARIERVSFLTLNEKRQAVGYAPVEEPAAPIAPEDDETVVMRKYRPDQARAPLGQSDGGQWVDEGGGSGDGAGPVHLTGGRGGRAGGRGRPPTPEEGRRLRNETDEQIQSGLAKEKQFNDLAAAATPLRRDLRKLDPQWKGPVSLVDPEKIEGQIRHLRAWNEAAAARIKELSTIPDTNPDWSVNRLVKELYARGYRLDRPARDPGLIYENPATGERVRIMEKPETTPWRTDPSEKRANDYYYRYRRRDGAEGAHMAIPDKKGDSEP
jgi:HK97 family phage portal protein